MKIAAPHIANLFDYGTYQGISETVLRQSLEDSSMDVCDLNNTVDQNEFLAVYKSLVKKSENQFFGLYYGCYLNIKALGFIAEISLNATNIEQAVYILQQYLQTTFPLVTLSVVDGEDYELHLSCHVEDLMIRNHLLDTVYCFIYRELKLMLAEDLVPQLNLPYSHLDNYRELLSISIEEGESHSISLKKEVLTSELNAHRVKVIELLLPQLMLMQSNKQYDGFAEQVRNMILNMSAPQLPNFEQVSNQFPYSDRTIQRKLTTEGHSFRNILDDVKKEFSKFLSKGAGIKIQDIASILGYSESSAYLHAVKRWEMSKDN